MPQTPVSGNLLSGAEFIFLPEPAFKKAPGGLDGHANRIKASKIAV